MRRELRDGRLDSRVREVLMRRRDIIMRYDRGKLWRKFAVGFLTGVADGGISAFGGAAACVGRVLRRASEVEYEFGV